LNPLISKKRFFRLQLWLNEVLRLPIEIPRAKAISPPPHYIGNGFTITPVNSKKFMKRDSGI
jgi:hypothetical protein